jgi:dynein heavy chain, axonemal
MGQGQEYHARRMMTECMATGGWVLLQNVHLSLNFCSEVIDILMETEHIQDTFRLWVTTEVHQDFPIVNKFNLYMNLSNPKFKYNF